METKERNSLNELFVDERDVKFWRKEGEKYSYLYWVRAMLGRDERIGIRDQGSGVRDEPLSLNASQKISIYRLLAQGLSEPTEELAKSLSDGTFFPASCLGNNPLTPFIKGEYGEEKFCLLPPASCLLIENPIQLLDSLKTEYTRIFLDSSMPFIPPYESIYRGERRVMGEAARQVAEYYKKFGLGAEGEMPDHIAHECEFMTILYEKNELALAKEFLRKHLLDWGPKLCYDLKSLAKDGFYEAIALIGNALFSLEAKEKDEEDHPS